MTKDDIIRMAREADLGFLLNENWLMHEEIERFAALVAQRERDKLTVMFLEAHEGAKDNHNYWHVAANKIKEKK